MLTEGAVAETVVLSVLSLAGGGVLALVVVSIAPAFSKLRLRILRRRRYASRRKLSRDVLKGR